MSNVLNTVLNNFMTTYTPKSITQYDTHKKSELRSVYHSIIKQNKESPWYLPANSAQTVSYAIDLKEHARALHNTIASLGGLEDAGLLNKKAAFSTDPDIISVTYVGKESPEEEIPAIEINVKSLASPQENMGRYLNDAKVSLAPDTYSFDVAINDLNYEFQFAIGESETNRDVQERLLRLINNADIGLNAVIDESDGKTSLKLTSDASGASFGSPMLFHVSDDHTSKRQGSVEYLGLDFVSHYPADAKFMMNGEERFAASNHFTIGKMFEVELLSISPEDEFTSIGLKTDMESLTDNVVHLADGYNNFLKAAANYLESQPRSRYLVQEFSSIAQRYQNSLESTGLNLAENGEINVDSKLLLQQAAGAEDIRQTFDYLHDFTSQLLDKSSQVSLNPMDYVDKKIVAYKHPTRNFASPYVTSAYSGMMFNGYC